MTWTNKPPVIEGWYWWRANSAFSSTVLEVTVAIRIATSNLDVTLQGGEWAGPIPEPDEE